jgi:hypothetical protein
MVRVAGGAWACRIAAERITAAAAVLANDFLFIEELSRKVCRASIRA